jgi:hypothetical protein
MPRYKLRPAEIEAVQFDGNNWSECISFVGTYRAANGKILPAFGPVMQLLVSFLGNNEKVAASLWEEKKKGFSHLEIGDYIAKETSGFYRIPGRDFDKFYELMEE